MCHLLMGTMKMKGGRGGRDMRTLCGVSLVCADSAPRSFLPVVPAGTAGSFLWVEFSKSILFYLFYRDGMQNPGFPFFFFFFQ